MTTHRLKTDPEPFKAVLEGTKKCELRFNDRGFQVGDTLLLLETAFSEEERKKMMCALPSHMVYSSPNGMEYQSVPHELTGRAINALVTHIVDDGNPWGGLEKGWVVMSIAGAFLKEPDKWSSQPGIVVGDKTLLTGEASSNCGAVLRNMVTKMWICPNCQHTWKEDIRKCPVCSFTLKEETNEKADHTGKG